MDPLTALSLAGTVIQFVDFGTKLLGTAGELYKSTTGSLGVHTEIELTASDLRAVIVKLRGSVPVSASQSIDDPWRIFAQICDEAASVADELVERLTQLRVKHGKHRVWHTIQSVVKTLWSPKEIAALQKRLSGFREALVTRVVVSIRDFLDHEAIRNSARFDTLDATTQQIVSSLLEAQINTTDRHQRLSREFRDGMNSLTITITHLLSRLESLNQDSHRRTRDTILEGICKNKGFSFGGQSITSAIEMLDISDDAEQKLRRSVQRGIIESLRFPAMTNRYEDVDEAYPSTFEWAFEDSTEEHLPWDNFSDWLRTGRDVYWAAGKAGSGKSTLMKHIVDSPRTKNYLDRWAKDKLCIASFFFWNSGTREQKSQLGLFRALLYQVLSRYPELVPVILPDVWATSYSRAVRDDWDERDLVEGTWPSQQLTAALKGLDTQKIVPVQVCLVVDGLDEFDGDHEQLGQLFKDITSSGQVKVCLSSRPWVVFEGLFKDCPKLRLQNLTHNDITSYVTGKVGRNTAFQSLAKLYPEEAPAFIHEIVNKADGVFLWVRLVVQSLLGGIRNMDEMSDLWTRLRGFPQELEPLYNRLLDLVEPLYMPWFSKASEILQANHMAGTSPFIYSLDCHRVGPLAVADFYLAINENVDITQCQDSKYFEERCRIIAHQLTARCAGFFEISKPKAAKTLCDRTTLIRYFHRTARDFLESGTCCARLLKETHGTEFNPNVCLMRAGIRLLWISTLQSRELDNTRRGDRQECVISLSGDILLYACHANADVQSHSTQSKLLDVFCHVMTTYDSNCGHAKGQWLVDTLISTMGPGPYMPNFLRLATWYNLTGYVSLNLPAGTWDDPIVGPSAILQFSLPIRNACWMYVPLAGTEMVSLLLERGADPNKSENRDDFRPELGSDYSAWQNVLYAASSFKDSKYDHEDWVKPYIEVMRLLVSAGANPNATIWREEGVYCAVDIVKQFMLERFPVEASALLEELQQKLEPERNTRKRARDWQHCQPVENKRVHTRE
ncbi:hypothetical protein D0Z07_6009 [Hyphodiscus hymeniophilus]|uniref:NACHT domain-containing protein n=1 Tax=Hyphodiscus hymeniophilus TaxID=353542 RepID=A0A9P6VI03_9HELO|nr:hypothetical protein D0Z07_6009 [Hyphodiscus hymeniophilus]